MVDGVDHLTHVVRRDVGGHAHGDALAAVDQQVGESGRQHNRLLVLAVVVADEVHGVFVDAVEHPHGHRGQAALGVSGGGSRLIERPEVALGVHQGVAQGKGLPQAHQGVVDGRVAMGVVLAHDVAHHAGTLHRGTVGARPGGIHAPQDAAMDRLQAITGVGQRPRRDDRHCVIQKGAFHLLLDLDGLH